MRNIQRPIQAIRTNLLQLIILLLPEPRDDLNNSIPDLLSYEVPRGFHKPHHHIDVEKNVLGELLCEDNDLED